MRATGSTATIIFIAVLLSACVARPSLRATDDALVGCWRGEGYQPLQKRTQIWVTHRKPDGTFRVEFQDQTRPQPNKADVHVEAGGWVLSAGTYTTVTTQINGSPAYYRDDYKVLELTADKFIYRHNKLGTVFTALKVSCETSGP
jgi:hypothetical protein